MRLAGILLAGHGSARGLRLGTARTTPPRRQHNAAPRRRCASASPSPACPFGQGRIFRNDFENDRNRDPFRSFTKNIAATESVAHNQSPAFGEYAVDELSRHRHEQRGSGHARRSEAIGPLGGLYRRRPTRAGRTAPTISLRGASTAFARRISSSFAKIARTRRCRLPPAW
jgi:hypothetical protein